MPFTETHAAKQLRKQTRREYREQNLPCWLCAQPIDYLAPPNTPNALDIDHAISTKQRPDLELDPTNFRPAHVSCNRARKDNPPHPPLGQNSRRW
ncbi:hypothetical protein CAQU_09915 [Corynebacterium aquilae DSM 44791]|uniref:HNH domain-containing protein n=1 Tax=Corynebacterium aquilae DSM 44791 TaxID=1431546 RepID=A0A1L7CHK5_9CORY|nr:hypothetical protein CAQU_09915 [Corynebacterium aquilae DSM 44791]